MTDQLAWWQAMVGTKGVASCRQVGRLLQSYLDGEVDDLTARRVARHLELCRRCGLEASAYAEIKKALARRCPPVPGDAHERLRRLAEQLMDTPPDQSAETETC